MNYSWIKWRSVASYIFHWIYFFLKEEYCYILMTWCFFQPRFLRAFFPTVFSTYEDIMKSKTTNIYLKVVHGHLGKSLILHLNIDSSDYFSPMLKNFPNLGLTDETQTYELGFHTGPASTSQPDGLLFSLRTNAQGKPLSLFVSHSEVFWFLEVLKKFILSMFWKQTYERLRKFISSVFWKQIIFI